MKTFMAGPDYNPGASEEVPAPEGTLPTAPLVEHAFPSQGHEHVETEAPRVVPERMRHGAFALHTGKADAAFSIAYNGMIVDIRDGQAVQADDGLFDAIEAAGGPVTWR